MLLLLAHTRVRAVTRLGLSLTRPMAQVHVAAAANGRRPVPPALLANNHVSFSTNATEAATAAQGTPPPPVKIPVTPSYKQGPPICRDVTALQAHSDHLVKAPIGSLFTYQDDMEEEADSDDTVDGAAAAYWNGWIAADPTIQLVEYVLRGHAAFIPGSLYYSTTTSSSPLSPVQHVQIMQALVQRLQDEGQSFADLRRLRLQQRAAEAVRQQQQQRVVEEEQQEDNEDTTTPVFCPPGPSTACFDILLDAMAAAGHAEQGTVPWTPSDLAQVWRTALMHHEQMHEENPLTRPTMQTYNAVLKGIVPLATMESEQARDDALTQAFGLFNALTHATDPRCRRNAATFTYMLHIVARCFPPSRTKGNISVALTAKAQAGGVFTSGVAQALQDCHVPANGPEFDAFLADRRPQNYEKFPTKWIRWAKQKRYGRFY